MGTNLPAPARRHPTSPDEFTCYQWINKRPDGQDDIPQFGREMPAVGSQAGTESAIDGLADGGEVAGDIGQRNHRNTAMASCRVERCADAAVVELVSSGERVEIHVVPDPGVGLAQRNGRTDLLGQNRFDRIAELGCRGPARTLGGNSIRRGPVTGSPKLMSSLSVTWAADARQVIVTRVPEYRSPSRIESVEMVSTKNSTPSSSSTAVRAISRTQVMTAVLVVGHVLREEISVPGR